MQSFRRESLTTLCLALLVKEGSQRKKPTLSASTREMGTRFYIFAEISQSGGWDKEVIPHKKLQVLKATRKQMSPAVGNRLEVRFQQSSSGANGHHLSTSHCEAMHDGCPAGGSEAPC